MQAALILLLPFLPLTFGRLGCDQITCLGAITDVGSGAPPADLILQDCNDFLQSIVTYPVV